MYIDVRPHYLCQHNHTITQNSHLREQNLATSYVYKQSTSPSSLCTGPSMHAYLPQLPKHNRDPKDTMGDHELLWDAEHGRKSFESRTKIPCFML